jgi:hypothetical protein
MGPLMGNMQLSDALATVIETIPSSGNGAVVLFDSCRRICSSDEEAAGLATALVTILKALDAVQVTGPDGRQLVKARSPMAHFFLMSLAAYVREGRPILSNWEREGITEGPYSVHEVLSGPQFLYFLEKRRIDEKIAGPIRKATVVKAIIKARVRGKGKPVFLLQYDPYAREYQLIGGHKRATDIDIETALRREIQEELSHSTTGFALNYDIIPLGKVTKRELSLTYGVYTEYDLHYSQVRFNKGLLHLGPNDRWVTQDELLSLRVSRGVRINESAIGELEKLLPGGLEGLALSLDEVQRRSVQQVIQDHPWEVAGLVLGIVGIILTIIIFFLGQ